jgi:hypothetical protein
LQTSPGSRLLSCKKRRLHHRTGQASQTEMAVDKHGKSRTMLRKFSCLSAYATCFSLSVNLIAR